MKNVIIILIVLICVFLSTCNDNKGSNSNLTTCKTTTGSVFIYPLSFTSTYDGSGAGDIAPNSCSGTSSGSTEAPFYSTSTHNLKDRLPSSKWCNPVYSPQGHEISSSWESLWDGSIDMSLHQAEVIADNDSTGEIGFWTGTKSDGTFSGHNCRDWSSNTSTDNGTWGSFLTKHNYSWTNNNITGCDSAKYILCFRYD